MKYRISKRLFVSFFPLFNIGKDTSRIRRFFIYIESLLSTSIVIWIIFVLMVYKLYFPYVYKYDNINFYSSKILEKSTMNRLFKSVQKQSAIDLSTIKADVYLGTIPWIYYAHMFPGLQLINHSSAVTYGDTVYFKKILIDNKENNKSDLLKPYLHITIAHELVHCWQNKRYSLLDRINKELWVTEGYAMYASNDRHPKLKTIVQKKKFLKKYKNITKRMRQNGSYDLWKFMVKHAIEKMHKSVDDLHQGEVDYDEVLDSLLAEYNISK